jgi:hypothetical protein
VLGRGSVKCDSGSTVAGATHHVTGASGTAPDDGVRFLGEFSVTAGACASGQVLNFGSLAYVADYYGELHLLHRAAMVGNEPPVSSPPPRPSRADLEVLTQQDPAQLGPRPHHVGTPPDVLYAGERSPLDHHWQGAPAAGSLLELPPESPLRDPERSGSFLDGAGAPRHP